MNFTSQDVKALRERTGAGMMDCKNALAENDGDMEKAIDYLREKGIAKAAKKATRIAAEGIVDSYIHMGGKIAVAVSLSGGDDELAKQISMHIAANNPQYLTVEDVPADVREHEMQVQKEAAKNDEKLANKPAPVLEKILEGKINKYFAEMTLEAQPFLMDDSKTVGQFLKEKGVKVLKFVRYQVGEGIEKRQDDFASEVMSQMK